MFKVNNRNTRIRWEICSKLTRDSLVSLLLTLNIFHTLFTPCLGLKKRLLFGKILRKGVQEAAISLFIKVETHAQVFSCEFCKIFRNTSGRMLEYWFKRISVLIAKALYCIYNHQETQSNAFFLELLKEESN